MADGGGYADQRVRQTAREEFSVLLAVTPRNARAGPRNLRRWEIKLLPGYVFAGATNADELSTSMETLIDGLSGRP